MQKRFDKLQKDARNQYISRSIIVWLSLTAIALAVMSTLALANWRTFNTSQQMANQSRARVYWAVGLSSSLHSAESGAFGYLATGDRRYIDELRRAEVQTPTTVPEGVKDADVMRGIRARYEQLDHLVALARAGNRNEAIRLAKSQAVSSRAFAEQLDSISHAQIQRHSNLANVVFRAYKRLLATMLLRALILALGIGITLTVMLHHLKLRGHAEMMLRQEAQKLGRLTEIIDATPDFIGISDVRGKVLYRNRAMREMLGKAEGEGIGDYIHVSHTPASIELLQDEGLPAAMRDGVWQGESCFVAKDGSEVPVSQVLLAHRDDTGTVTHLSTVARDITGRKNAESEIIEKQRFVERIAAASPNVLYLYEPSSGSYIYINDRLSGALGLPLYEMGDPLVDRIHQDDVTLMADFKTRLLAAGDSDVISGEFRFRHADGQWRWLRCMETVFLRDADGKVAQTIGVAEDVTEQRLVVDEMTIERNRLSAIVEAKHEIMRTDADLDAVMQLVCRHAQAITHAEAAAIELRDGDEMVMEATCGYLKSKAGHRFAAAGSLSGACFDERRPLMSLDTLADARVNTVMAREHGTQSLLLAPLVNGDKILGVLKVCSTKPAVFNDGDLQALTLISEFFGLAIDRAAQEQTRKELLHERTEALVMARDSEQLLRLVFDTVEEGLLVERVDGTVELCNAAASRMLGLSEEEIVGSFGAIDRIGFVREDGSPMPPQDYPWRIAALTGTGRIGVVIGLERIGRPTRWMSVDSAPLLNADGRAVARLVTTYTDISVRREAQKHLEALATTDGLTGIRNHRAFQESLAQEISRANRYDAPLSLVMIDVDHFKSYNDTFGHPAGDLVLAAIGSLLKNYARVTDVAARYGGEEFALLLPQTDTTGATVIAERIRAAIESGNWDGRPITVSIGIAAFSRELPDPSDFVARADRALYRAKTLGRNRVCVSRRGAPAGAAAAAVQTKLAA